MVTKDERKADVGATAEAGVAAAGDSSLGQGEGALALGTGVRVLLWDYARGSLAYDLALALIALIVLLVPAGFWDDPLWRP